MYSDYCDDCGEKFTTEEENMGLCFDCQNAYSQEHLAEFEPVKE